MAQGDKTVDPVTGEPEIELADGSKVTDWDALKAAAQLTGPAVERVVAIKNPGFGTILGDFNFMMALSGNRSIQIRTVSGTIAYTDFNTYWSAGAGGDNDAPFSGNWDETWRYANANLNMTAHNHYQHVEFIANGWFYHVHMVVGPGFNNNRFTLTRWRLEGVKDDAVIKRIYTNVADQAIPDGNINTYAVDLPDLEVGDKITVVVARGTRLFECTSRFLFFGQLYESVFTPGESAWTVEVVGTQLRIQAFGDGAQAVKAIFIER